MITQSTWGVLYTPSVLATDIASASSSINTTNKYEGKMIWDSTNKRLMRAAGGDAVDQWAVVDGSTQITPV